MTNPYEKLAKSIEAASLRISPEGGYRKPSNFEKAITAAYIGFECGCQDFDSLKAHLQVGVDNRDFSQVNADRALLSMLNL